MGSFTLGHLQTVWSLLHKAGISREKPRQDDKIVIVSPWHHNAARNEDGWSSSVLEAIYSNRSTGSESLSDILAELVCMGYEVTMVTLSQHGRNMAREDNAVLDREKDFFEILNRSGVHCCLVDDIHHKYLRTPFDIMEGSMNLSKNGLFGKTRDTMTLISRARDENGFNQHDQILTDILHSSKPYYERPESVKSLSITPYQIDKITNIEQPNAELPELVENIVIDETFAPNVPLDMEPIGQVSSSSIEVSYNSTLIQANGLIETWVSNFIGLVQNELYDHLQADSLHKALNPFASAEDMIPSLTDILTQISSLSEDSVARKQIQNHLQLSEETAFSDWVTRLNQCINLFSKSYSEITSENSNLNSTRQKISRVKIILKELSLM